MPRPTRSSLVTETARQLREMILSGRMQPGEFFPPQKEMAAKFGVGLSTMHEAFQVLAHAGLVKSSSGKGTWVSEDALDTVVHPVAVKNRLGDMSFRVLHEARSVIEVALAEYAATRATSEDLQRIWEALETMESLDMEDEAFAQADLEFHMAVARAGHNELLEQFYHVSFKLLADLIAELLSLRDPQASKEIFCRQNRQMAEAIQARDRRRARQIAQSVIRDIDRLMDPFKGR